MKKGHRKLFSNNKWREVFTNKPFHTSHDIFVNEDELTIMNRVTEVEYDDIGGDNNEKIEHKQKNYYIILNTNTNTKGCLDHRGMNISKDCFCVLQNGRRVPV